MTAARMLSAPACFLLMCAVGAAGPEDVVHPPTTAEDTVTLVLQLGTAAGDPSEEFDRITDLVFVDDSTLLVMDANVARFRLFALDGRSLRDWGRRGRGPAESEYVERVFEREGEIWSFDGNRQRLQRWSERGQHLGTFAVGPLAERRTSMHGVLADGSILVTEWPRPPEVWETGHFRGTSRVLRIVMEPLRATALGELAWGEQFLWVVEGPEGGRGRSAYRPPFVPRPSLAVLDSTYWYAEGWTGSMERFDGAGRLVASVEVPVEPQRVGPDDRAQFREGTFARFGNAARARIRPVLEAARGPLLAGVRRDELGVPYVRVYRVGGPQ